MSKARQKGSSFESLIRDYFNALGFDCDRLPLSGSKDVGDLKVGRIDAVFELKNCSKLNLSGWLQETETERINASKNFGFTIFKRKGKTDPAVQYALMPVETLAELLKMAYPDALR